MSMDAIEAAAKAYAEARSELAEEMEALAHIIAASRAHYLPEIRRKAAATANAKAELAARVEEGRGLFKRPKTRILHGIKVGLAKGKGKVSFADSAAVVKRIRAKLPRRFKTLVKVTETPIKTALARLSATDLKKIGVTVSDTEDEIVVAATDSDIDKLVKALLDAHDQEATS